MAVAAEHSLEGAAPRWVTFDQEYPHDLFGGWTFGQHLRVMTLASIVPALLVRTGYEPQFANMAFTNKRLDLR
jgi:hypothetical protein